MSVTAVSSRPRVISLEEWDEEYTDRDERYELVDGIPVLTPREAVGNSFAAATLMAHLGRHLPPGWIALPQIEIQVAHRGRRYTMRQPDVAVVARNVDRKALRVTPDQVALAVEVVSPNSIERDWITKRAEYAAAGIPAYLVIDVRDAEHVSLTLFENPREGAYPDVPADAPLDAVTLHINGVAITITAEDLSSDR